MKSIFKNAPVLLANMQTYNGDNPSNLRYSQKNRESFNIRVYEEQSNDSEMDHHSYENIGYMAFSVGTAINDSPVTQETTDPVNDSNTFSQNIVPDRAEDHMEIGEVSVNHDWTSVHFTKTYAEPVVIASGLSYVGDHPATIRIRNVSTNGFEIRVEEWDYLDGHHKMETVGYVVAERGMHILQDGTRICAGSITTSATSSFTNVEFDEELSSIPVVLTCITTENDSSVVTSRIKNISQTGFETGMQEQERSDQSHATETISYIAWETSSGAIDGNRFEIGTTGKVITQKFNTIGFDVALENAPIFLGAMQTYAGDNPSSLRYENITGKGIDLMIQEEQSKDSEMDHIAENVGYLAFEK